MKVGSQIPEMHTLNLQEERFIDERNLQINLCFSLKDEWVCGSKRDKRYDSTGLLSDK